MAAVKTANRDAGRNFFSPDTMQFFRSRIESRKPEIFGEATGNPRVLFITSEQFVALHRGYVGPREFTVRVARPDGTIDTLSDFCQFKTYRDAVEGMYLLQLTDKAVAK
jgi:hypothetical protein